MRKMFLFILAASITTESFSQQASTPADTSKTGLKAEPLKISRLYNPLRYSYSLMTPDMKGYKKSYQPYYQDNNLSQAILTMAGQILMSIFSDRLGYRYDPTRH